MPGERHSCDRDRFGISVPAPVRSLVGEAPERLAGYGSCLVLRGRGVVAKVGQGAEREAYCLTAAAADGS